MILVAGANGHLGCAIVDLLLERPPPVEIAVSVCEPEKASPSVSAARTITALEMSTRIEGWLVVCWSRMEGGK